MSEETPKEDIWELGEKADSVSSDLEKEDFAQAVVNRVHQRIFIHDVLLLIFVGFVGILLGFMNDGDRRGGTWS